MTTLEEARAYVTRRGVGLDIARHADLRVGTGDLAGRVVLPWRGKDGRECYLTGRALNGRTPKYLHSKGQRPALFASPGAWEAQRVALVEGHLDALVCASAGTSAFATAGSSLSDAAVEILATKQEVVLFPDADEAGARWLEQAVEKLSGRVPRLLRATVPDGSKDAADVAEAAVARGDDPAEAVAELLFATEEIESKGELRFEVLTARETCELPEAEGADELLGSLLVKGSRVVLGAHTGHGKTTLTLQLARAVGHGEQFLEWTGPGARVLVIDAEQGLRTVKRRLSESGLDKSECVDYLRVPDGLELDQDDDEAAALERVLARGNYGLVILDPLYKLHGGDSNDERSAVDLMRLFDGWREGYGFCLLLPVHCRKPPMGAKFSMHEFFGSTAYLRGAEVVLGLQLLRPGYSRLHYFKDRDGDLPLGQAWGLLFDRETGFRRDPDDGKPKETAAGKVAELLEADPGMTTEKLVQATGYVRRTVERALKDLGATEKTGPHNLKLWTLPPDGDAK